MTASADTIARPGGTAGPAADSSASDSPASISLERARAAFPPATGYLAACTMGLPAQASIDALRRDLDAWQSADASPAGYEGPVRSARSAYARLVGVDIDRVAIGSQTSVLASMVACSVPDGAEVLCVDGDFSSMVFPFLAQERRGVTVRHVQLEQLAESIDEGTWLVAFSLVQSATGRIADAAAIVDAARRHGARTLCDTTQAAGWYPVDARRFDATICHTYKWLCSPRGVTFFTVTDAFAAELNPVQSGWYAGEDPWQSCYGPSGQLAECARRFDVSPAWQAFVGAAPALDLFASVDMTAVTAHDASLGNALCDALGIPAHDQAIVTWSDPDGADLRALSAAGITASGRAGNARVAFHLWNDADDVESVLRTLRR